MEIERDLDILRNLTEESLRGNMQHYNNIFKAALYPSIDKGIKATEVFPTRDYEALISKFLLMSLGDKEDMSQTFFTCNQCNLFCEEYRIILFKNSRFWYAFLQTAMPDFKFKKVLVKNFWKSGGKIAVPDVQFLEAFLLYVSCSSKKIQYLDRTIEPEVFVEIFKRLLSLQKAGVTSARTVFSIDFGAFVRETPELQQCYGTHKQNQPVEVLCSILTSSLLVDSFAQAYLQTEQGIKVIFDVLNEPLCYFMAPILTNILLKTMEIALLESVITDIENLIDKYDFDHLIRLVAAKNHKLVRKHSQAILCKVCDAKIFYEKAHGMMFPPWEILTDVPHDVLEELLTMQLFDQTFSLSMLAFIYRMNNYELPGKPPVRSFSVKAEMSLVSFKNTMVIENEVAYGGLIVSSLKCLMYITIRETFVQREVLLAMCFPFTKCSVKPTKHMGLPGVNETTLWVISRLIEGDETCIVIMYQAIDFQKLVEETERLIRDFIITQTLHPQNCSQNMFVNLTLLNHMLNVSEVLKFTPIVNTTPLNLTQKIVRGLSQICSCCIEIPFLKEAVGKKCVYMLSMLLQEDHITVIKNIKADTIKTIRKLFENYNTIAHPYLIKPKLMFAHHFPVKALPCKSCAQTPRTIMQCTGCDIAHYCNEVCQRKDWPNHKLECETGVTFLSEITCDDIPGA